LPSRERRGEEKRRGGGGEKRKEHFLIFYSLSFSFLTIILSTLVNGEGREEKEERERGGIMFLLSLILSIN